MSQHVMPWPSPCGDLKSPLDNNRQGKKIEKDRYNWSPAALFEQ